MPGVQALTDMDIKEITLGVAGKNRRRHWAFTKENTMPKFDTFVDEVAVPLLKEGDPAEGEEKLLAELAKAELSDKAMNGVKSATRILNAFRDELPEDLMNKLATMGKFPMKKEIEKADPVVKELAAPIKKEDGTLDLSVLPEAWQKEIASIQKEADKGNTELVKLAKAVEDGAKETADLRKEVDFRKTLEEVKDTYPNVSGKTEDTARELMEARGFSKEFGEKFEARLKKENEINGKAGIFKEAGSGGGAGSGHGTLGDIEARATELMKEDSSLTKPEAIAKAVDQNPDLHANFNKERGE